MSPDDFKTVKYQMFVLSLLMATSSKLFDLWTHGATSQDLATHLSAIGFSQTAISKAIVVLTGATPDQAKFDVARTTITALPTYGSSGLHPSDAEAEVMARLAKSFDQE